MTAKNVKIIANEGKVTLRGPVKTAEEREQVAALAQQALAGGGLVDNQLEVKQTAEEKNQP
jgi:osmotically-inducible protein OsmY